MSIQLRIADAASGDDALAEPVARSLLLLLDRAGLDLDHRPEDARRAIGRAAALLRTEIERSAAAVAPAVHVGELAAWQVTRVTAYIDRHLAERIHIDDLSRVARRSPAHFCRAFKRTLGETPHGFITRRRLRRAQQLMLTGDDPLSQIAVLCGFWDQAHFCNRFRQETGLSPAAWRRERRDSLTALQPNERTIA